MPRLSMLDTVNWRGMDFGRRLRGMLPWLMRAVTIAVLAATPSPGAETISGPWVPVGISSTLEYFLDEPSGVAVDGFGNIYISQHSRHRVLRVDAAGLITRFAGIGWTGSGGDGGPASQAALNSPQGVAVDGQGNVYIADTGNHQVRKVDVAGTITTFAGIGGRGYSGDGGFATQAKMNFPRGVAMDGWGNVYIADSGNDRVRKVDAAGTITTLAGTGVKGYSGDGGPATHARLDNPRGVVVDGLGNVYIADTGNFRVRKVDMAGTITTFAGTGEQGFGGDGDGGPASQAKLSKPVGVAVDGQGNVYITLPTWWGRFGYVYRSDRVRKVDPAGTITTFAGIGSRGYSGDGGPAVSAELNLPHGVAVDGLGNVYIADSGNHRVRKVDAAGTISTFVGTDSSNVGDYGPATWARLENPGGVAVDGQGNVYIADSGNDRVRKVDAAGTITTLAGTGVKGYSGDGGPATHARLDNPRGVAVDGQGNVYIADSGNDRVRKVDAAGTITNFAGGGGGWEEGEPATWGALSDPMSVAVDGQGNVYIADTGNHRVRKVDAAGTITSLPADTYRHRLTDVEVDGQGNVYISVSRYYNYGSISRVDKMDVGGTITRFAGNNRRGYSGDGAPATRARLSYPGGVAVDGQGNVYIADSDNYRVRKVDTAGIITTFAGTGGPGYGGDGGPATRAFLDRPLDVAVDALGYVYIADSRNDRVRKVDAAGTITTFAGALNPTNFDGSTTVGGGTGLSDATPLALDQSLGGRIETATDSDYFLLDFSETTDVAIYTTGSLATKGTLLDSTKTRVLASDSGSQGTNFRIEATVEAGEYYVKVESYGNATGVYTLHVRRRTVVANAYGMEFELLPKGSFSMGSTSSEADPDEQPVRRVTISQPFYMGKHEVTQGQWKAVMGADSNPSRSRICDTCPVDYVSWNEALEFVQRLNDALGTTVYRLPTEAEWEYAARAGEKAEWYAPLDEIAWHEGNSGGTTQPVGEKRANAFGLHDMLGNVWEWVQDWHGSYEAGPETDPTGPATGSERTRRGGSWYSAAEACRLPSRFASVPSHRASNLGLRLVMTHAAPADPASRPSDDHGNSFSTATALAIGGSVEGYLGDSVEGHLRFVDSDFFRLDLTDKTSKTDLLIYTTGSSKTEAPAIKTEGTLWAEGGTEHLAGRVGSFGADGFVIEASLDPGTYFVRVRPVLLGSGGYTLHVRPQKPTAVINAIGMEFVEVSGGEFTMGSNSRESHPRERPVTPVSISGPFYMGKHEVTQAQWKAVMGQEPAAHAPDGQQFLNENCEECPVDSVTWAQAQRFIAKLTEIEDGKRSYRLPTEAEWEYAARAGTTEDLYADDLAQVAWYLENSDGETHPVGRRLPNALGLYDMLGNVTEWVDDWAGGRYPGGEEPVRDPIGPGSGQSKLLRGCSAFDASYRCRSARRSALQPDMGHLGTGFRLVLNGPTHQHVLDDHPNGTNEPLRAGRYDVSPEGLFELHGDFANGSDVDYLRLRVPEPTSVTVSVRYHPSGERAEVRLGKWSEFNEPGGIGWRESCSFETGYNHRTDVKGDLEPGGGYCIMAKSTGQAGEYRLALEASRQGGVDLEKTPKGTIVVVQGPTADRMDLRKDAEELKFEIEREIEGGSSVRNFQLPSADEKTRVAIFVSSDSNTQMFIKDEVEVVRDSFLSSPLNYPVIVDVEDVKSGKPINMGLQNDGKYTLRVVGVRLVREEDFFRNALGMEFSKLPHSEELEDKLEKIGINFDFQRGSEQFYSDDFNGDFSPEIFPPPEAKMVTEFWMGRHEVTQCQWAALMENDVSSGADAFSYGPKLGSFCRSEDGRKPIVNVTFRDAEKFVEELNERLETNGTGYTYRLPKDVEWEYAAQSGVSGERYGNLDEIAWHGENSGNEGQYLKLEDLKKVGLLAPNAFGLHDMLGNVWEWVDDDYALGNIVTTGIRRVVHSELTWTILGTVASAAGIAASLGFIASTGGAGMPVVLGLGLIVGNYIAGVGTANQTKTIRGGSFTSMTEFIGSSARSPGIVGAKSTAKPHGLYTTKDQILNYVVGAIASAEVARQGRYLQNVRYIQRVFGLPLYVTKGIKWLPWKTTFKEGIKPSFVTPVAVAWSLVGLVPGLEGLTNPTLGEPTASPALGFRVAITGDPPDGDHLDGSALGGSSDDHLNSVGLATEIQFGQSIAGVIGTCPDDCVDVDYFKFKLDKEATVAVYTTGKLDTIGRMLDFDLDLVQENDNPPDSEDRNFRIEADLDADRYYYVEVKSSGGDLGAYTLHIKSSSAGKIFDRSVTNSLEMEFALIRPEGEFEMGSTSPESNAAWEQPVTLVRISRPFYMGKYEVTQAQWEEVMGSNPSNRANCADCPVEQVSWNDAQTFVTRLNRREGTTLYRLPTEAEWEWAARGGTTGERYSDNLGEIAWYRANSRGPSPPDAGTRRHRTHPVGGKLANEYGLHDMLGNVFEWVEDNWWKYPSGAATDPVGDSANRANTNRVIRGCSWNDPAHICRAAYRFHYSPDTRHDHVGFRLVRDVGTIEPVPPADDHSNDRIEPTQIRPGQPQAGRIETGDDVDVFIFGLYGRWKVTVYTTGELNTSGRLLDFDSNRVATNRNSGAGSNFLIERTLDGGAYFVEVWSSGDATGAYELHLEIEAVSDP